MQIRKMREKALLFTPHPYEVEYENLEDGSEDLSIPYYVKRAQIMNQYYKQAIIRNPVVASLQDLDEQAMMVPFLRKCYGNWERDEDGSFCQHPVSPSSVRLDVLMKIRLSMSILKGMDMLQAGVQMVLSCIRIY